MFDIVVIGIVQHFSERVSFTRPCEIIVPRRQSFFLHLLSKEIIEILYHFLYFFSAGDWRISFAFSLFSSADTILWSTRRRSDRGKDCLASRASSRNPFAVFRYSRKRFVASTPLS